MKFPRLEIFNFLAITEASLSLADRGLVVIQGKNSADSSAKSNGAGKSSIADALCWCWFGKTARDASGDEVVNDITGKDCMVRSIMTEGGLTYTATRYRKHKTGKNRFTIFVHDGLAEKDLTKGTDVLTQALAVKIIGASLDVFTGSIYAGQEKMPDLPALTDRHLKMIIEEAAGVTTLEEAYKIARDKLKTAVTAASHSRATFDRLENFKAVREADLLSASTESSAWNDNSALKLSAKIHSAKELLKAVIAIDAHIHSQDLSGLREKIVSIDAKISGVEKENFKLISMSKELHAGRAMLGVLKKSNVPSKLVAASRAVLDVGSLLGKPCGECGRPLTEAELTEAANSARKRKEELKVEAAKLLTDTVSLIADQTKLEKEIDSYKLSMTDISTEQADRHALSLKITNVEKDVQSRAITMSQARVLKSEIESIKVEVNPHKVRTETISKEIDSLSSDIASTKISLKAADAHCDTMASVVKVFSPAGVRARILDEVTPFLNKQTASYLSVLSDGNIVATWSTLTEGAKKGEFKEKFSIDVSNSTGGKSFKLISGGEKRKVRIATCLALQDLVSTRASKPIELFIGDEIDEALDAAGLERLMSILEEKARSKGSVMVISHNELSDYISNVITVEKDKSGRTIVTEVSA